MNKQVGFLKTMLIFISLALTVSANSQEKIADSYLMIRFERVYDYTFERAFYTINAEQGADKAVPIYSMIKYDPKKKAANTNGKFFFETRPATDSVYNYFLSPSEGLNFMAANGWQLVSAFSETFSGYKTERDGSGDLTPITTVGSRAVFCFRK